MNRELSKSWVFVDSEKFFNFDDTNRVQEVTQNEPHLDSDTDSISVISESGCSYKTDEEELSPTDEHLDKEVDNDNPETVEVLEKEVEVPETEKQPEILELEESRVAQHFDENKAIEKLMYFATSAVCAIILVGVSVAVQHYFQYASNVNIFDPDYCVSPHVQNLKSEAIKESSLNKFNLKRKSQLKLDELENKIAKLQENKGFHGEIVNPVEDNDPKTNNKHKNEKKSSTVKGTKNEETETTPESQQKTHDETCNKKVKELKIKEDYLREKEKFLIEKEHDLLKKEIKLNKEKETYVKKKHDKKSHHTKEKLDKNDSSEESFDEEKITFKLNKKQIKNSKKCKNKEKRQYSKQYRFSNKLHKKRNMSGQWYIDLHEGRDNMRQKKRASFKKNKANWYFQWMVDRARLRVK